MARRNAVVFGARHLGKGIAAHLLGSGWSVTAVARSPETIEALAGEVPDAVGEAVDLAVSGAAAAVLADAAARGDGIDLVVNAIADPQVSASALSRERDEDAHLESAIGTAVTPVHNVVDATLRLLHEQGHGCFIQITGGLALRAQPGTGPLAATGYATRALIEGAVPESRERGVHVALLVIRGLIESDLTAGNLKGKPESASMTQADVAAAIEMLVAQGEGRAWTHEVVLTPPGADWSK